MQLIAERETPARAFPPQYLANTAREGMRHHGLALTACLLAAATEAMQVGPRKATAPLAEPSCLQDVAAFHSLFGAPVVDEPALPDAERCALRVNLLQEELDEFRAALEAEDIVEAADALADIQYVLAGAVHELGMGSRFKAVCTQGLNPGLAGRVPDRSATHAFEPRLGLLLDSSSTRSTARTCPRHARHGRRRRRPSPTTLTRGSPRTSKRWRAGSS